MYMTENMHSASLDRQNSKQTSISNIRWVYLSQLKKNGNAHCAVGAGEHSQCQDLIEKDKNTRGSACEVIVSRLEGC